MLAFLKSHPWNSRAPVARRQRRMRELGEGRIPMLEHSRLNAGRNKTSRDEVARNALRWSTNLLVVFAAVILFVLAAEVTLRAAGREILATTALEEHPQIGYTWRRNLSGRLSTIESPTPIRINSLGLRDREYGPKPSGVRRVLVLGDSITAGYGVREESTFVKIAERKLNENDPKHRWEIVNAGVPGYSTEQELELLRAVGRELEPNTVLVAFYTGNDLGDNFRDRVSEPYVWKPQHEQVAKRRERWSIPVPSGTRLWLEQHSAFYVWFTNRYDQLLLRLGVRASVPIYTAPPWTAMCKKGQLDNAMVVAWRLTFQWVAQMKREAEQLGATFGVLLIPCIAQVDDEVLRADMVRFGLRPEDYDMFRPNSDLAATLRQEGVPLLDVTEALRANTRDGKRLFYRVNTHLTPVGHEVVASALSDMLTSLGPAMKERSPGARSS